MKNRPLIQFRRVGFFALLAAICGLLLLAPSRALAGQLTARSIQLSSTAVSEINVSYNLSSTLATTGTLGSIVVEFCSNDPFVATACTAPTGLNFTASTLGSQSGETGFSVDASTTANKLVLSRAPSIAIAGPVNYVINGVTNPSTLDTFYARLQTFASNNGSGAETDRGGLALSTTNNFSVSTEVPPYLDFCVAITISGSDCSNMSGSYINFGNFSSATTSNGSSQFMAATNAGFGYNVTINGTTMTSGNNTIPALAVQTASTTGTGQFGINLRANTVPSMGAEPSGGGTAITAAGYNTPNLYKFVSGDTLTTSATTDDYRKFTVSYIVNVPSSQPAGDYSATATYICLANF